MLDDYKKAVIFSYLEKKENNLLSSNLTHPTPGQLRDECLLVLHSRPEVKDEKIIKDFFNLGAESHDYSHNIMRFDVDKLRPLAKIMRGKIEDTGIKNIELLAWLIDFNPRPYQYGAVYGLIGKIPIEEVKDIKNEPKDEKTGTSIPSLRTIKTNKRIPLTKYGIDIIILLITVIGGIGLSMRNASIERDTTAYICTSKVAKKYHLNAKCHGLNNCKSEIVLTTIAKAKELGKVVCEIER